MSEKRQSTPIPNGIQTAYALSENLFESVEFCKKSWLSERKTPMPVSMTCLHRGPMKLSKEDRARASLSQHLESMF